jgi:hypothetical protein
VKAPKRKKPGRKPLPPAKRRDHKVTLLLTTQEMERLERLAEKEERPVGQTARRLVERSLKRKA